MGRRGWGGKGSKPEPFTREQLPKATPRLASSIVPKPGTRWDGDGRSRTPW